MLIDWKALIEKVRAEKPPVVTYYFRKTTKVEKWITTINNQLLVVRLMNSSENTKISKIIIEINVEKENL